MRNMQEIMKGVRDATISGLFIVGLSYGMATTPYDNPYTGSRACAMFRTDGVKQMAYVTQADLIKRFVGD